MNTLKGFLLLALFASSTSFAQTGTTIPPAGPHGDDPEVIQKEYKRHTREARNFNNDVNAFLDSFKERAVHQCEASPYLPLKDLNKKSLLKKRSFTLGDVYSKVIYFGLQKSSSEKCKGQDPVSLALKDSIIRCIFSDKTKLHLERIVQSPYFDSYISKEFPEFKEPRQVRILFQQLLAIGMSNDGKK